MTIKIEPKYLTTKQASEYLNVSERRIWQARTDRDGPKATKIGRSVFYTREALDTWVEDQNKG